MSRTVLIIGCGVAGPVLAILLKRKGYTPIVFEKVKELGDAGASLTLMPNGLKVLGLVDLASQVLEATFPLTEFHDQTWNGATLGVSHIPSTLLDKYSMPAAGVRRTALNLGLKQSLFDNAIELREGWKLEDIQEKEHGVIATFAGRGTIEGTFIVGCDGIKATSRELLLRRGGEMEALPTYTGLTQTAGISPTPSTIKGRPSLLNVYGIGAHFITYPVSHTHSSWAITLPETMEAQESWHLYNVEERDALKSKLLLEFANWSDPVPELIKSAERMVKFGLYDRDELTPEQWHSGRCVLIGDAAHPTSPHLGQGANQALEDCYHLATFLPKVSAKIPTLLKQDLAQIFQKFALKRQPRTSKLVKGARAQGERRVVTGGSAACLERDEAVRKSWLEVDAVAAKYDNLFREPF
ncbi:hypothetical protein JMJ35_008763 [Cladonia borealis]|uniref:FAD-binding domain-containing protein n=1 Tax=Cladonia borealis TaxID=184061 RepID=A0AA39QSN5_9LECA|nr:hypothetical protein JMJ35_008763 [Cladonia borealis]